MAERDLAGFARHVSEQALFFAGAQVLRGKAAVVEGLQRIEDLTGRKFGGKDHTTVMHAVKRVEELCATERELAEDLDLLSRMLGT